MGLDTALLVYISLLGSLAAGDVLHSRSIGIRRNDDNWIGMGLAQ